MQQDSGSILLIEDDEVDIMIIRRALKELKINHEVVYCGNGEEALKYLQGCINAPPFLILLDLNMPKMNGFEFLRVAKSEECLKRIPIIVLTTSKSRENISECFALGATGYIVKPVSYEKFVEALRTLEDYWNLSRMPAGAETNNECFQEQGGSTVNT
jgi:CheY-like chemotaxis protein